MILQPTTQKLPANHPHQHSNHTYFSKALSFSSGLLQSSTFFLKQPIISTSYKTHKNPVFITCSLISKVHSYGTTDYERRPMPSWNAIYKKIFNLGDSNEGSASVLNEVENDGKILTKWEISRLVKQLRQFRRFKHALEVYEWMNNRPEKYRVTTSDTAIQLDLIAKVHGVSSAEQYFHNLPDALKDKRIYGSLLNSYCRARIKEKAESLMDKMRNRGYAIHILQYNVMMTLYMNLNEHEKVESLISEVKEKNIPLDIYTYNIWLSSRGSQGSAEKMEKVFETMEMDPNIIPNWSTFSTMATMYLKLGHVEKAQDCLKNLEARMTGRARLPYHYLISIYGSAGNKEEVYRVWNLYKANFVSISNLGYHTVISSLVRVDDVEGAEKIYDEWLLLKSHYDPRIGNVLLSSYVRNRLSQKAETFFDQMIEVGGKPNAMTWEILAEDHLKNSRITEAISCLQTAAKDERSKSWRPKPSNMALILEICEKEGDLSSKETLLGILRQLGCLDDPGYMLFIGGNTENAPEVEDSDGADELLEQLQESL